MDTFTPKPKTKRSRSQAEGSDSNFIKSVSSVVTGLLPSRIAKWFKADTSYKAQTSNTQLPFANGSIPVADATDTSTEDEAPENMNEIEPPAKRMRHSSPVKFDNHIVTQVQETRCLRLSSVNGLAPVTDTTDTSTEDEAIETGNIVESPIKWKLYNSTSKLENKFDAKPNNEEDKKSDENIGFRNDSSLGMKKIIVKANHCSTSTAPVSTEKATSGNITISNTISKLENNILGPSLSPKRKTLFGNKYRQNNKHQERKLSSPGLTTYPFYCGRATYGGEVLSMNQNVNMTRYSNIPNIQQQKTAVVNKINEDSSIMSQTTKRIMEYLEEYSTLMTEAKGIPQYTTTKARSRHDLRNSVLPYHIKPSDYKWQQLNVPSIPTLLRIKQKSRIMDTTNAARQMIASHSSASRNYISSTNNQREAKEKEEIESLAPVSLPTAVLQIDQNNLPKFTFTGNPSVTVEQLEKSTNVTYSDSQGNSQSQEAILCPQNEKKLTEDGQNSYMSCYKFSAPLPVLIKPVANPQTSLNSTSVTYHCDEDNSSSKNKNADNNVSLNAQPFENNILKITKRVCADSWTSNKEDVEDSVSCTDKKLGKVSESKSKNIQENNTFQEHKEKLVNSSKWRCDDCWVENNNESNVCVCCGASKKNRHIDEKSSQNKSDSKCVCRLKSNFSSETCNVCSKPGLQESNNLREKMIFYTCKTSDAFNIAQSDTSKWKCDICLVQNDSNKSKCVCCEATKPGTVTEAQNKCYTFNKNIKFKFGIDPKMNQADDKKEQKTVNFNLDKNTENVELETNNNTVKPTFNFGLPTNTKFTDQTNNNIEKTEEPKTVKLIFDVEQKPNAPTFAFESETVDKSSLEIKQSTVSPESERKETLQEVPKINFTPLDSAGTLPSSHSEFPLTSESPEKKLLSMPAFSATSTDNNEILKNDLKLKTPGLKPNVKMQKNNFTFSNTVPNQSLSGSSVDTLGSFSVSNSKTQSVEISSNLSENTNGSTVVFTGLGKDTEAKPKISLFQNKQHVPDALFKHSETNPVTTAMPFFQTKSPISVTTVTAPQNATPVFSFGSNTQSVQPQVTANTQQGGVNSEKTNFSFTFGTRNKTETPSLFKSSFSVTDDKSSNLKTNKFTLPPGNSGNVISPNPLENKPQLLANTHSDNLGTNNISFSQQNPQQSSTASSPPSTNIFSPATQAENVWSVGSGNNTFVTNSIQNPATFTFGSSRFTDGGGGTHGFVNNPQMSNIFNMTHQNTNSQQTQFSSLAQTAPVPNVFGSPPTQTNTAVSNPFGSSNVHSTPAFGASNPPASSFEVPSITPTFNFGAQQNNAAVFTFRQQQPQSAVQAPYSFSTSTPAPQVQFNMGSAPSGRRMRKAVRRSTRHTTFPNS